MIWSDETSEGRDEARRALPWVPKGLRRIVKIDPDGYLVRLLQFEEEARDDDRCESAWVGQCCE